ncbi:MAG: ComF family protein [Gammaproteobacteria bacterium]|nr:ComF family protein [Gammaproteobacteria bacterium]
MTTPNYFKKVLAWLFPYTCILCHYPSAREQDLCADCLHELPILPQSCPRCANTFAFSPPNADLLCGSCLANNPPFDTTFALFNYVTPITKMIMELKFHERLINANILGDLMYEAVISAWYQARPLPDLIIPIPLHPKRQRERGFNQTIEIARPLAHKLKLPLVIKGCHRVKYTDAQARLHKQERKQNLVNAFKITRSFKGLHVAVLDDVITTGQTITHFCQALRAAGAAKIDVWCCAKTQQRT